MSEQNELNPDEYLVSQYDEESNANFFDSADEESASEWLGDGTDEGEEDIPEEEEEEEVENEEEVEDEEASEEDEEDGKEDASEEEGSSSVESEPTAQVPDPEQARQILQSWETELEGKYQKLITPEKALQILSDPEKVLPELLKEVHVAAIRDAATMFQQMLPIATQTNMRQVMDAEKNEQEFFAEHRDLFPHKKEFDQFFMQYRSLPVNAGRGFKDISKEAAYVFRARKGIVREGKEKPTRVRPAPPPALGGASSVPSSARQTNPFASLAEEFMQEDI
ncbi:MAG: hypothetical protein HC883_01600 [Bdellovibrionaceae bacterium]|nr:hypothetical protein [Pseudobdellovibrionaceae bacterium]